MQTPLCPEVIEPAWDREAGVWAYVSIEGLTVVTNVLDNPICPVRRKTETFAELALDTKQTPDVRIVGLKLLVHVGGSDAELLRIYHCVMRPTHNIGPLLVVAANRRAQWLFRDHLWQHRELIRVCRFEPVSKKC